MDHQPVQPSFHATTGVSCRVKIVDIGANPIDGRPPYASLLQDGHADVVGFEPNLAALARLDSMKGPHETYLPHAIGDGTRHTLRFCQAPGMTSLLTPDPRTLGLFHGFPDWGRVVSSETIDTVRLDDIEATRGADLIKLDIQGAELMALRHAQDRLRDAVIVQTEVEFLPLYVDQPLYGDIEILLRGCGFLLHRFFPTVSRVVRPLLVDQNIYAGLSQVVWADAVFIRDLTQLDRLSDLQLLSMAILLHDCYGSIDVALHLLAEHDRRQGTGLAGTYLAALRTGAAMRPAAAA